MRTASRVSGANPAVPARQHIHRESNERTTDDARSAQSAEHDDRLGGSWPVHLGPLLFARTRRQQFLGHPHRLHRHADRSGARRQRGAGVRVPVHQRRLLGGRRARDLGHRRHRRHGDRVAVVPGRGADGAGVGGAAGAGGGGAGVGAGAGGGAAGGHAAGVGAGARPVGHGGAGRSGHVQRQRAHDAGLAVGRLHAGAAQRGELRRAVQRVGGGGRRPAGRWLAAEHGVCADLPVGLRAAAGLPGEHGGLRAGRGAGHRHGAGAGRRLRHLRRRHARRARPVGRGDLRQRHRCADARVPDRAGAGQRHGGRQPRAGARARGRVAGAGRAGGGVGWRSGRASLLARLAGRG